MSVSLQIFFLTLHLSICGYVRAPLYIKARSHLFTEGDSCKADDNDRIFLFGEIEREILGSEELHSLVF